MTSRLSILLIATLAVALPLAGCGSSSTTTTTSTTSATTATGTNSTIPGVANNSAVQQAVSACKHGVQSASSLSASTKARIEAICDKAGSGDLNAAREAARELCVELVNSTPLPAGSVKEKALAACKTKQ